MSDDTIVPDSADGNGEAGAATESAERQMQRLREALEAKTREAQALQDRALRLMAEFDNAKKRAAREREEYVRFANESLIRELLPVVDNFDRALLAVRTEPGAAAVAAGVARSQRELLRLLENVGAVLCSAVVWPFAA